MINPSPLLSRFEARDERLAWDAASFEVTLARFAALRAHARQVNPELRGDRADDLAADRRIPFMLIGGQAVLHHGRQRRWVHGSGSRRGHRAILHDYFTLASTLAS
jgi:hypothetical protein